ncbi:membrane protein [Arthrobacter phage Atuin]|nr:membrane protein [Arthrobacter phage Atuin]
MELPVIITILITMASPYINAYFNKVTWSPEKKNLVALASSLVIAVAYIYFTGGFHGWDQLAVTLTAVYGLQQATYQFLLKVSASKFEAATRQDAVILTPTDENKVEVTTTDSIKAGETISVEPPVSITPNSILEDTIKEIVTENPVKG